MLTADEIARANGYGRPDLRTRFVARRGMLRTLLGNQLGEPPSHLVFENGMHGKPRLVGHNIEFSISSSGDEALVAISNKRPIGVDIEHIGPCFDYRALLSEHFTESEAPLIRDATAFFKAWTRKEACAKAIGLGLSIPLASYEVADSPVILSDGRSATLLDLIPPPGFAVALAVIG